MGKIKINSDCVKGQAEQLQEIASTIQNISDEITNCSQNLRWNIASSEMVRDKLTSYTQQTQKISEKCNQLSSALMEDMQLYQDTEKKIANSLSQSSGITGERESDTKIANTMFIIDWIQDIFNNDDHSENYEIDSVVFDNEGSYGGDQGSPQQQIGDNRKELYSIVREYYPDWTDQQINNYLRKLNSEGCGYVAIINTIFRVYEGREKEFQQKFGFPMYKNADLNYNDLIVDFYTATDNHNRGWFWNDTINGSEDPSETQGWGTTPESQKYRTQLYLKEKDIEVGIQTNKKVNVDNYKKLAERGSVIINYHFGNLYDANGRVVQYINGGHSMTVTGVTEDGKYIVSSWGEKYYIDPEEMLNINGNGTSYDFVYYKYKK